MWCERLISNNFFELKNVYSIMDLYIEYSIEVNVYGFKKKGSLMSKQMFNHI